MPDREWLRNLATAKLTEGGWQPADAQAVRAAIMRRIAATVDDLQVIAEDYADALRDISGGRLNIRVFPVAAQPETAGQGGFMLLLARHQMTVTLKETTLEVELVTISGFERHSRGSMRFIPRADSFGSVLWQTDNTLLMTSDLIIKKLFEHLTRATLSGAESED